MNSDDNPVHLYVHSVNRSDQVREGGGGVLKDSPDVITRSLVDIDYLCPAAPCTTFSVTCFSPGFGVKCFCAYGCRDLWRPFRVLGCWTYRDLTPWRGISVACKLKKTSLRNRYVRSMSGSFGPTLFVLPNRCMYYQHKISLRVQQYTSVDSGRASHGEPERFRGARRQGCCLQENSCKRCHQKVSEKVPSLKQENLGMQPRHLDSIIQNLSFSHFSCSHLRYCLGTDQVLNTIFGEGRVTVTLSQQGQANGLIISSTLPTADQDIYLVETRELIDDGTMHTQVSNLNTTRYLPLVLSLGL